ncbi:MAG: DNA polymerase I [Halanaerobiales bacterium]|nr:DNA polymerase I [Halanaerobiales bacterium]
MEKLYLLDGHSLAHRAFYALPLLTNEAGEYTNSVFGFVRMLFKIIDEEQPDHLAVAFDLKGPTFRHKEYKDYKAGRKKTPEELVPQISLIKNVLKSLNIPIVEKKGYEADDVIGTIAKEAAGKDINVKIVTGDRDALQLIDDRINVIYTRKGITDIIEYNIEKVKEQYELVPHQLIDMKGLMGDSSDNIPGVPGIGEKTATKLLKEYNNMENVLNNIDNISGKKRKENLRKYSKQAEMSKRLGKIVTDLSIDLDFAELKMEKPNYQEVVDLFKRLEFNSLLERFEDDIEKKLKELSYNNVKDEDAVDKIVDEIKKNKQVAFVINRIEDELLIKSNGKISQFQPFNEYKAKFIGIFEDERIKKLSFNSKDNIVYLSNRSIDFAGLSFDPQLASYLLNPDQTPLKLKNMIMREFDVPKGEVEKADNKNVQLLNYLFDLKKVYIKKLKEKELWDLYNDIELPLVKVLAQLEINGIYTDCDFLKDLSKEISKKLKKIEKETFEIAGEKFNLNSPKQLGKILFDKLDLPIIKKTKTGYSTSIDVLEKLEDKHDIIPFIMEYRKYSKLKSTYVDPLLDLVDEQTGRIHTSFNQMVTATGRLSSTEPNLQNIPIRTEEGRKIRQAFVPENKDWVFLSADYSQIELRVLAHISDDQQLIKAFNQGQDIHTQTASEVFDVTKKEVNSNLRRHAKVINFGIAYGMSSYGLAQDLDISNQKAQAYIDKYFERFPGVKRYMDHIVNKAKKDGYVRTIFNRLRYIKGINSSNYHRRSFAERAAINTPIQGSAADIMKIAMLDVYKVLHSSNLQVKMLLQIHDEIVFEAASSELAEIAKLVKDKMEKAVQLKVPIIVDLKKGKNLMEQSRYSIK